MLDFVEAHSGVRFEIAAGFLDYQPRAAGRKTHRGPVAEPGPFDLAQLGAWGERITSFPADWSNVDLDAESRSRLHADVDERAGDVCVAGTALVAGLLTGLLDGGVTPCTNGRADQLVVDAGEVTGVRIAVPSGGSACGPAAASFWGLRVGSGRGTGLRARIDARRRLAAKTGIGADGLIGTVERWNRHVAAGTDPDFGRGSSAYDGYRVTSKPPRLPARGPTVTAASSMSAGSPYPACLPRATQWPVLPAGPTVAREEPSVRQWFSAFARATPPPPGSRLTFGNAGSAAGGRSGFKR